MSGNVRGVGSSWTITGKYQPPGFAGTAVTRARLTDVLDVGVDDANRAFTMLSAPAGFGKTFLLSQWASTLWAAKMLAAWCTLDQDDRDPQVMWSTITSALALAAEGIDDEFSVELASTTSAPITAEVQLHSVRWGTRIDMACTYGTAGDADATGKSWDYGLWVVDRDGQASQLSTWKAIDGSTAHLEAGTSLTTDQIATVQIRAVSGKVVATSEVQ